MTKREAGSLGGRATVAKHGRAHMRRLAQQWHAKYTLKPIAGNDFLIVERETGRVNGKTLNGERYNPRQK